MLGKVTDAVTVPPRPTYLSHGVAPVQSNIYMSQLQNSSGALDLPF